MQVADIMHTEVKSANAEDTFADVAKTHAHQRHLVGGGARGQEARPAS